jgi:tRNA G10  N-methylase Trm11
MPRPSRGLRTSDQVRRPPISPAVYSKQLIAPIASAILEHKTLFAKDDMLLDPMAGRGFGLAEIASIIGAIPVGIEIEPGYVQSGEAHPCVRTGDALKLPFADKTFAAAATSPPYPNGISDNFRSKEPSKRHTYIHRLRAWMGDDYELHPNNTGGMNPRRSPKALQTFYETHEAIWAEVYRVLKPGAVFVVNTKDPLNIPFRTDTQRQLARVGFEFLGQKQVEVNGLNHGAHAEKKYSFEDLTVVRRPY